MYEYSRANISQTSCRLKLCSFCFKYILAYLGWSEISLYERTSSLNMFNPLWSGGAMFRHKSGSTLAKVMACCLQTLNTIWTNVHLPLVNCSDIHLRVISQEISHLKMIYVRLSFNSPWGRMSWCVALPMTHNGANSQAAVQRKCKINVPSNQKQCMLKKTTENYWESKHYKYLQINKYVVRRFVRSCSGLLKCCLF